MANNRRVITLGLDNSEFNANAAECQRRMRLLDAEFRQSAEEMRLNSSQTDQLRNRQQYLTERIQIQTQRVEQMRQAYENANNTQGTSQRQLDALRLSLTNQETALARMNNELQTANESIAEAGESAGSFGDSIRGLASTLGLEVSPAIEAFASKFDGVSKEVGNAIVSIAAIGTVFVKSAMDSANFADDLITLSTVTGITTDELQKMQYASKFLDVEVSTMTDSMKKLTNNMNTARNGSKELNEVFKKLHVSYKDSKGNLKDVNEVFYATIDALGKVKNETERDAMAMKLMGKSAQELNPLIEAGSKRLKELGIEADNLGTVISEKDLEKMGALKDAMDRLESTTDALKNSLGVALLPILTGLFDAISRIPVPVLKILVTLASVIASIMLIVKAIKSVVGTIDSIKSFLDTISGKTRKTTAIILGVVAAVIALATVITVLTGKSKELQDSMKSIGDSVSNVTGSVQNAQKNYATVSYNASGTENFRGGRTWVGENGPELVDLPRGSRIYNTEESQNMAGTTVNNYNITIEARSIQEFNDIVRIVQGRQQATRRGIAL